MDFGEVLKAILVSTEAMAIYGTLLASLLVYLGKNFLEKAKAKVIFSVLYTILKKIEEKTPEDTHIDAMLDALIPELVEQLNEKQIVALKQVSDKIKAKKQSTQQSKN